MPTRLFSTKSAVTLSFLSFLFFYVVFPFGIPCVEVAFLMSAGDTYRN